MWGAHSLEILQISKEIISIKVDLSNHSCRIVLPKQLEWSGRLGVQKSQGFKQLETKFSYIFSNCKYQRCTTDRSTWLKKLLKYMSWYPDPWSCAADSLQHLWRNLYSYAFPLSCLIRKVLAKVRKDQCQLLIYTTLLSMWAHHPVLIPSQRSLLHGPQGQLHPLQETNQLQLLAWMVSRKYWKMTEYQHSLQHILQVPVGRF